MIQNSEIKKISLPSDQNSSGRTLGTHEVELITEAINSGTLTSTKGKFVKEFETKFAELVGAKQAHCASHGTAALHTAYAALDPEPGDEFITTPITDMGALTPILYQGAVPVFADVDHDTLNVTAETIETRISPRTKAIVVTHLFGNPCEMGPIMELARSKKIPVIEDCAQAFMAKYNDKMIGTVGDIGCFSLQQGKHITTGEGGIVVTNNEELGRRMFLFINKAWGYGDAKPDHYFLAPNYRMNELSGAVALAQLNKLDDGVQTRIEMADRLTAALEGLQGITTPNVEPGAVHTYWKYCVNVNEDIIKGGAVGLAKVLREEFEIFSAPRYVQKPAFQCEIFRDQRTFGNSRFPFTAARPESYDYDLETYAGALTGLNDILVLPWNEKYTTEHVDFISMAIQNSVQKLA
ncbi:DegT/DnrJ/EryC1/StrS family aminotransferase [bacterium]|nr:DegT/DnrJ/EryC1/StrS family aminotransferase [bacterium]